MAIIFEKLRDRTESISSSHRMAQFLHTPSQEEAMGISVGSSVSHTYFPVLLWFPRRGKLERRNTGQVYLKSFVQRDLEAPSVSFRVHPPHIALLSLIKPYAFRANS